MFYTFQLFLSKSLMFFSSPPYVPHVQAVYSSLFWSPVKHVVRILIIKPTRLPHQAVSTTCMIYTCCCVYSARLLMMDRENIRNM